MMSTTVQQPRRRFLSSCPNPSSRHLSYRTSRCPSVTHANWASALLLILWVLYTGMQWKCLPVPTEPEWQPIIHYTTIYKVFAEVGR